MSRIASAATAAPGDGAADRYDDGGDGPTPGHADRFRPTRAGIVNLWDYRDEEFVFADGRLVLRGPNGSGKTKALEVLFPFVLDGRTEPRRLNPFAGEERTMKSNLLYRGQDGAYAYVWMEFHRSAGRSGRGEGGGDMPRPTDDFVTIGVGLRAQRHNDRVSRWYFVADGRVGVDFSLLGPDDRPLTRKQLAEQIGIAALTDRSAEHRAAVDARLFRLGAERYDQLLTLVLTLRRPQLAKNLDPKGLSRALTEGLRPLEEDLVAEAARSFGDMETVQRALAGLVAADEAAAAFIADYTTYLRAHARAAADQLAERVSQVQSAAGALAGATAEQQRALHDRQQADGKHREASARLASLLARLEALQASPAYRDRQQLDKQADLITQLAATTADAARRVTGAAELWDRRAAEERSAREKVQQATTAAGRAATALAAAAAEAGIGWEPEDARDDELATRAGARAAQRDIDIADLRQAHQRRESAGADRERTQGALRQAQQGFDAAQDDLTAAETALDDVQQQARVAVRAWAVRHAETLVAARGSAAGPAMADAGAPDLADALAAVLPAVGTPDGGTLTGCLDELLADGLLALQQHDARHRAELAGVRRQLAGLRDRRTAIAAEKDDAPPPFAARTAARDGRAGAPLWRLVRFADEVTEADRAGIEAGLHAANLLDAWVDPEEDAPAVTSETVLRPLPESHRPAGRTLHDVLVPDEPVAVPADRVRAILASIRLDASWAGGAGGMEPAAAPTISPAGWFTAGLQVGSHASPVAEYIGAGARARRRVHRIAELDDEIAEMTAAADDLQAGVDAVTALVAAVDRARADLPATGGIVTARRAVDRWAWQVAARRDAVRAAGDAADRALTALSAAENAARRTAAERALPAEPAELDGVAAAVRAFTLHAGELAGHRAMAAERRVNLDAAAQESTRARAASEQAASESADAAELQAGREEELATLRAAVGAGAEQVQADIDSTRTDIAAARGRSRDAQAAATDAVAAVARAEERCAGGVQVLRQALRECRGDADRLRPFAAADLHPLLRVETAAGWPASGEQWPDPDIVADRAAADLLASPDTVVTALPPAVSVLHATLLAATAELRPTESSLKSSSTRVSTALDELQRKLSAAGHDYKPEWNSPDGIIVVQVADEQGYTSIGAFAEHISAARRDQEQLLTESERHILEDALLGRLAQQIHERTLDARDLIGRMSREMGGRRMSSGATVGIRWELADGLDERQREICHLLDRDAAQLDSDHLAMMRGHFAGRIKNLRAAHPDRSYQDVLAEALDYRAWRAFVLTLTPQGGSAERLTQARHSTLSGGEQSVSLHLPLFAAAHVMLSSAERHCPRLVALDEAFAGIDDSGRSELLGLTAQFDLDLFMTGHDLWATFATVPACAHYDLSHSALEHSVSALLLVWDGDRILADGPSADLAATLGSPGTRRRAPSDEPMLDAQP